MNTIFTLGDESSEKMKLNLDELYEKKQQQDLNTLSLYNKILGRIEKQIGTDKDNKLVSLDIYHGMKTNISYSSLKNELELLIKEIN